MVFTAGTASSIAAGNAVRVRLLFCRSMPRHRSNIMTTSRRGLASQLENSSGTDQETLKRIREQAHIPQTPVSLRQLVQTGQGEFIPRADRLSQSAATEQILMQVSSVCVCVCLLMKASKVRYLA